MDRYYHILALKQGQSIIVENDRLTVDLDTARDDAAVTNDLAFRAAQSPGVYFWLSGGGSYLVDDRYLFVLRRDLHAHVNSNKFSLFTGRADNRYEHRHPFLLARELFEELLLFSEGRLCQPVIAPFQDLVHSVYKGIKARLGLDDRDLLPLPLEPVGGFEKKITVKWGGSWSNHNLNYQINQAGDINVLMLFSAQIDVAGLSAVDGEYLLRGTSDDHRSRDIFLYDLKTGHARQLTRANSAPAQVLRVDASDMTEHLAYIIRLLRMRYPTTR